MNKPNESDIKYIQQVIELSKKSLESGEMPFAALIAKDVDVISKSINGAARYTSDHAEILAINVATDVLGTKDLTGYTLYSNCEPCPMCSFMIREHNISKVVFSAFSPYMGGLSKWNILGDKELEIFYPIFGKIPEIIGGVLEDDALKIFSKSPLWMFGKDVKNRP